MKLYRLAIVMHGPSENTEEKYLGEIPAIPGCQAWGDTAAEALENLQGVAAAFIESYRDKGDPLPLEVESSRVETSDSAVMSEVLVAV